MDDDDDGDDGDADNEVYDDYENCDNFDHNYSFYPCLFSFFDMKLLITIVTN